LFFFFIKVAPNCGSDETLDASSLLCVNPSTLSSDYCNPYCGPDGGEYNVERKGCLCNKYQTAQEVCNGTCNTAVQASLKQDDNGKQYIIQAHNGETTTIAMQNMYGLNDFDRTERHLEFVTLTDDGSFGIMPTELSQIPTLLTDPTQPIANNTQRRRRRAVGTSPITATQGIRSPVICVQIGEAVMWQVNVKQNRSESNYPQYRKNHLYNTNPNFDYGKFRELNTLVQNTDLDITTFANVFSEAGVFVFYDNENILRETIVMVPSIGSSCPGRMDAPAPFVFTKYNIGPQPVSWNNIRF